MPKSTSFLGLLLLCAAAAIAGACSGGGGSGGGPTPTPSPSGTTPPDPGPTPIPGSSSGTLKVSGELTIIIGAGSPFFRVVVLDSANVPVNDATVQAGAEGALQPMVLHDASMYPGEYVSNPTLAAYPDRLELSVTRGAAFLTGVKLPVPPTFTLGLDPDPPVVGSSALLTWSSAGYWSTIEAQPYVALNSSTTYHGFGFADVGSLTLPGTAFPGSGPYDLELTRLRDYALPSGTLTVKVNGFLATTIP